MSNMEEVLEKAEIHAHAKGNSAQESQLTSDSDQRTTMSRYVILLFAAACGMSVANIYFAQPLLDQLSVEFGIEHSLIGIVITITQIFYGLGLLLLVPLGDMLNQRRLIIGQMLLSMIALV
ncbi:MFS transporter, partial [Enterobacter quasiroggenkampii]|nr:MFS transporter [Enterobacter quasiroggenkampii]